MAGVLLRDWLVHGRLDRRERALVRAAVDGQHSAGGMEAAFISGSFDPDRADCADTFPTWQMEIPDCVHL